MHRLILSAAVAATVASGVAVAEVKSSAPDGMVLQYKGELPLPRDEAWTRLVAISSWWNGSHTYSGDATNLTLDAVAGGCWCEMWEEGEIEHGRVVMAMKNNVLRVQGAFGPLQELGVNAVLTVTLADGAQTGMTSVTMDYRVVGSSLTDLSPLAPIVDGVLQEQVNRLVKPE